MCNTVIIDGETYIELEGTINEDLTLTSSNKYLLSGGVFVDGGAVLTIEECTEVCARVDIPTSFLSIQRGAKIIAQGTSSCPIVFKPLTDNPQPGDWGGIVVNGRAPINTGTEAVGEGNTGTYGGQDSEDNSGVLSYVRVEYAGKLLGLGNELNGFSFNGVGSGTSVEFIQAYRCADDGIEFFGGTVSVNNAVSTGNLDDGFDWTYGWSGTCANWVVIQDPEVGDRGIEADNNGNNNAVAPYSNPIITNIHLTLRDSVYNKSGIKLREGTKGNLSNIFINGSKKAVDVQHDQTLNNVINGELTVSGVTLSGESLVSPVFFSSNNDFNLEQNASSSGNVQIDGNATVFDLTCLNGWTREL